MVLSAGKSDTLDFLLTAHSKVVTIIVSCANELVRDDLL
jgi:hypothetical protein